MSKSTSWILAAFALAACATSPNPVSNAPLTVTLATATPGSGPYCPANWLRKLNWGEEAGGEQVVLTRLVDDTKKLEFLGFAVGKEAIELQLLK